jgi:phage gp46-like protein
MPMDFAIAISGADGQMTYEAVTDLANNIWLSLFTKRGSFFQDPGFGSRLYLLRRQKNTAQKAALAKSYCQEALQWLLDSGRAVDINVLIEEDQTDVCRLNAQIGCTQANGQEITFGLFEGVA